MMFGTLFGPTGPTVHPARASSALGNDAKQNPRPVGPSIRFLNSSKGTNGPSGLMKTLVGSIPGPKGPGWVNCWPGWAGEERFRESASDGSTGGTVDSSMYAQNHTSGCRFLGATSMKNFCTSSDKIGETTEFERSLHDASVGVTGLCV